MSNFLPVCRIITIIELKVTAFNAECDKFYDYAQAGKVDSNNSQANSVQLNWLITFIKVYYIANCSVKAANRQYRWEQDLILPEYFCQEFYFQPH